MIEQRKIEVINHRQAKIKVKKDPKYNTSTTSSVIKIPDLKLIGK